MQVFALDLENKFFDSIRRGRLRIIGSYLKVDGEPNTACLVLLDGNQKIGKHPPFVIPLNGVWRWLEESNSDHMDIAARATNAVVTLGRAVTNDEIFAVVDAVRDAVDDLMKSDIWIHLGAVTTVGEAVITNLETGEKHEEEIKTLH